MNYKYFVQIIVRCNGKYLLYKSYKYKDNIELRLFEFDTQGYSKKETDYNKRKNEIIEFIKNKIGISQISELSALTIIVSQPTKDLKEMREVYFSDTEDNGKTNDNYDYFTEKELMDNESVDWGIKMLITDFVNNKKNRIGS